MAFDEEEQPSRWSLFIEVRDCLKGILAPRLKLPHLLEHGERIASEAGIRCPKRPLQSVQLAKFASAF
jgi:hypothetical protein